MEWPWKCLRFLIFDIFVRNWRAPNLIHNKFHTQRADSQFNLHLIYTYLLLFIGFCWDPHLYREVRVTKTKKERNCNNKKSIELKYSKFVFGQFCVTHILCCASRNATNYSIKPYIDRIYDILNRPHILFINWMNRRSIAARSGHDLNVTIYMYYYFIVVVIVVCQSPKSN